MPILRHALLRRAAQDEAVWFVGIPNDLILSRPRERPCRRIGQRRVCSERYWQVIVVKPLHMASSQICLLMSVLVGRIGSADAKCALLKPF